jgi:hypothetical protein
VDGDLTVGGKTTISQSDLTVNAGNVPRGGRAIFKGDLQVGDDAEFNDYGTLLGPDASNKYRPHLFLGTVNIGDQFFTNTHAEFYKAVTFGGDVMVTSVTTEGTWTVGHPAKLGPNSSLVFNTIQPIRLAGERSFFVRLKQGTDPAVNYKIFTAETALAFTPTYGVRWTPYIGGIRGGTTPDPRYFAAHHALPYAVLHLSYANLTVASGTMLIPVSGEYAGAIEVNGNYREYPSGDPLERDITLGFTANSVLKLAAKDPNDTSPLRGARISVVNKKSSSFAEPATGIYNGSKFYFNNVYHVWSTIPDSTVSPYVPGTNPGNGVFEARDGMITFTCGSEGRISGLGINPTLFGLYSDDSASLVVGYRTGREYDVTPTPLNYKLDLVNVRIGLGTVRLLTALATDTTTLTLDKDSKIINLKGAKNIGIAEEGKTLPLNRGFLGIDDSAANLEAVSFITEQNDIRNLIQPVGAAGTGTFTLKFDGSDRDDYDLKNPAELVLDLGHIANALGHD